MSLFSSIGKAISRGAKSIGLTKNAGLAIASVALPGIGGLAASALASRSSSPARLTSTAPATTTQGNIPIPGQALERLLPGGETGFASRKKFKPGKLTGQPIPHGYHEKMSNQGVIYLVKSRRRRGITARDLQTFRRVHRTIKTYGKKFK
jgi:hypothetical protein